MVTVTTDQELRESCLQSLKDEMDALHPSLREALERVCDRGRLEAIHSLAQTVVNSRHDKHQLRGELAFHHWDTIMIAAHYLPLIERYPGNLAAIASLHRRLLQDHLATLNTDGYITDMGNHLYALTNIEACEFNTYIYDVYASLVSRYPEHTVRLVKHINVHGADDFDHEYFRESLEQGAVAEGWL